MKITRFNPRKDLIIVSGRVWGPRSVRRVELVVDTGAAETIIVPHVLDAIGYSPRDGENRTIMRSASGQEDGYVLRLRRFRCLGFQASPFRVIAQDLPEGWGIEGLLGLTFLRQFNYHVRSLEGRILVDRARPDSAALG